MPALRSRPILRDRPLLLARLASAFVILSILLTLVGLDYCQVGCGVPGAWLTPIFFAFALLSADEVLRLLKAGGHDPLPGPVYLGATALPVAACGAIWVPLCGLNQAVPAFALWTTPSGQLAAMMWVVALIAVITFVAEMQRFREPGRSIVNTALGLFVVIYVGGLIAFLALLRMHRDNAWGLVALVSMLAVVKLGDTGAYAVGKSIGRNKLTPLLSPGKTIEGALGGLAANLFAAWLCLNVIAPRLMPAANFSPTPIWGWVSYGLIVGVAGMIGDLAESLLKRDMRQKDSSSWLPGLGGMLDIVDSILVAAPVAYLCWALELVGPRH